MLLGAYDSSLAFLLFSRIGGIWRATFSNCMATYTIKRTLFAIAVSVIAVSCTMEIDPQIKGKDNSQENLREVVFHAGWAPETKTVLQEDGSIWWSPGDEISIFAGSGVGGGYKFISANTSPAATADFFGQIGVSDSKYSAIYPYNETNRVVDGNIIDFTSPTEQIAKEGAFASTPTVTVTRVS